MNLRSLGQRALVLASLAAVALIGIDTPEVYFGVECGGPQASAS
jgi:hypothetical protein